METIKITSELPIVIHREATIKEACESIGVNPNDYKGKSIQCNQILPQGSPLKRCPREFLLVYHKKDSIRKLIKENSEDNYCDWHEQK